MTGLTRAFMVAGSRHVGATLWSVDDAATAEFMASMYKKIEKKGMTYEQAYRQTKAEFINSDDYAHPYYWAAFVLYELGWDNLQYYDNLLCYEITKYR